MTDSLRARAGSAGGGAKTNLLDVATQNAKPTAIILFGSPGSGKGTQAKLLSQCISGPHISTGDMLRGHIADHDEIGIAAQELLKAGKLVPDEMVNALVRQRVVDADCEAGMILDGYPRTVNQAGVLLKMLEGIGFRGIVLHLVVDYEKIVARLSGRRQCPFCGTLYSLTTSPPKVAGICDKDGTPLVTREDDREMVIRERLREYDMQTVPILNFFQVAGVPLFEIDAGSAQPDQVSKKICEGLTAAGVELKVSGGSQVIRA